MDDLDRRIINTLQEGFPLTARPFAAVAAGLGLDEADLLARLRRLRADNVLTRFGPLFNAEALGGGLTLAAMAVPQERFAAVADLVNAHPEVAHNYASEHRLNMWFVVATERPEQVRPVLEAIAADSGLPVYDMPKLEEFSLSLRFEA